MCSDEEQSEYISKAGACFSQTGVCTEKNQGNAENSRVTRPEPNTKLTYPSRNMT